MGNFIKGLTRKLNLHKFAAAFTAVCIVFMCVPFAKLQVSAAEGTGTLYFDDETGKFYTESTFENEYTALSSNYSWNSGTNTLTLTNFVYSVNLNGYNQFGISFDGINNTSINLVLSGTNSITNTSMFTGQQAIGIVASSKLITISGDGDLTITVNHSEDNAIGINGNVTLANDFTGSLTISATSGSENADHNGTGINGNITINNGTLNVTAGGSNAYSVGGNISAMSGGTLNMTSTSSNGERGEARGFNSFGTYSGGTIEITSSGGLTNKVSTGTVIADAVPTIAYSYWYGTSSVNPAYSGMRNSGENLNWSLTEQGNYGTDGYIASYLKLTPSGTGVSAYTLDPDGTIYTPVAGGSPETVPSTSTEIGSGTVSYSGNPVTFAANTVYTATFTLGAASGYIFDNAPNAPSGLTTYHSDAYFVSNDGKTFGLPLRIRAVISQL
jgi:hypothetical protein